MKSNSGRNHNEILIENIKVVSMEESILEVKILWSCFKIYPHCFYSSLWVLTVQSFLIYANCTDILARACVLSQGLLLQVLTFKNETLLGGNKTPLHPSPMGVSFLTCMLDLVVYFTFQSIDSKACKWGHLGPVCKWFHF